MDGLVSLAILLILAVLAGSVCGFIALAKISSLKQELLNLKKQLSTQQLKPNQSAPPTTAQQVDTSANTCVDKPQVTAALASQKPPTSTQPTSAQTPPTQPVSISQKPHLHKPKKAREKSAYEIRQAQFFQQVKENWMVWIGGVALALGGVFFVNYSLEAGLLSPVMRLVLGGLFGISLIAGAEYLHRKNVPFIGFANYIPAALAGGGFISLFALTLLALIEFSLISPVVAFMCLAVIAFSASWYALRFGPILAVLGILGAYSVPFWVSSGQGQWILLLCYLGAVSVSASLVALRVKRSWLWYVIWAAHLGWLVIALISASHSDETYIALGIFNAFSVWLLIIWPRLGVRFNSLSQTPVPFLAQLKQLPDNALLLAVVLISCGFLTQQPSLVIATTLIGVLAVPLLLAPLRFSAWDSWTLVVIALFAVLLFTQPIYTDNHDGLMAFRSVLGVVLTAALMLFAYGVYFATKRPERLLFSVLASVSIFVLLALSYANTPTELVNHIHLLWLVVLLASAAALIWLAQRSDVLMQQFCYWCGANANLTLGLTLFLEKTALSLALALQVLVMSYLVRRFRVPVPLWPIKLLVGVLLIRLTAAPWLDDYQNLTFLGLNWTTVFYPVVILVFALSLRLWQSLEMRQWLQGALLHLIALFVTTQTSLYLIGRMPDFSSLVVPEKIVLSMNWLLLGCAYLYREKVAGKLADLYRIAALVLFTAGGLLQLSLLVEHNPFVDQVSVGQSVLLSWLWLWWGVPCALLLWLYNTAPLASNVKRALLAGAGVFLLLLINGLIRQFWQGEFISQHQVTSAPELYSYSVIWLIIGAVIVVFSHVKQQPLGQKVGLVLLAAVVAKVFLVDMAHLTGLLKALSFIGLGLCLVALSWLFQYLGKATAQKPPVNDN